MSSEECDVITGLKTSSKAFLTLETKNFQIFIGLYLHFCCNKGRQHIYFWKAYDPENRMVILSRRRLYKKRRAIFQIFFLSFGRKKHIFLAWTPTIFIFLKTSLQDESNDTLFVKINIGWEIVEKQNSPLCFPVLKWRK